MTNTTAAATFTNYIVSNQETFNRLSIVDMMGRTIEERAQRFIDAANESAGSDAIGNITRAASAYMGITLVTG